MQLSGVAVKKDPAQTEDAKIWRLAAGPPQASTDLLADNRSLAGGRGQQLLLLDEERTTRVEKKKY